MGAVAVDLSNHNGISIDVLQKAAKEAGMRYNPDGSEYGDGHFHIDLGLNSKEAEEYKNDENVDKEYSPTNDDFTSGVSEVRKKTRIKKVSSSTNKRVDNLDDQVDEYILQIGKRTLELQKEMDKARATLKRLNEFEKQKQKSKSNNQE